MANKFAANFPIPSSTNVFQTIWKTTRVMKAAGWTYKASSDGTHTKDTSGTAANDFWGGNANPLLDTYPPTNSGPSANGTFSDTSAGWIVLQGPSTLRMPLNANPSGTFLRGETITQTGTGAEGELLGYVWDSVGGSGHAAILPRTGTFNMTTANTVTGSLSGATLAPLTGGTLITYVREIMFFKPGSSDVLNGIVIYGCYDSAAESTQLLSALATTAGVTATVAPGCGGTNNVLSVNSPKSLVIRGTPATPTTAAWYGNLSANFQTNAQIGAANCTPATGVSADGTFYCVVSNSGTANSAAGFGLFRLDDTEPGDCDPFVFLPSGVSQTLVAWNNTTITSSVSTNHTFSLANFMSGSPTFLGYQARGHATLDTLNAYVGSVLSVSTNGVPSAHTTEASVDLAKPMRVINSPATSRPLIGEPLTVVAKGTTAAMANSAQQYKGRCRWLQLYSVGNTYDTFATKTLLGVTVATTTAPCMAVGPFDGTTTPVQ